MHPIEGDFEIPICYRYSEFDLEHFTIEELLSGKKKLGKVIQKPDDIVVFVRAPTVSEKAEPCSPPNHRPFGTSGTSDAGASAPPEAGGGR